MNALIIILVLFAALAITVPLLERYQHQLGLDKGLKLRKYIFPLVGVLLVVQLIYLMLR